MPPISGPCRYHSHQLRAHFFVTVYVYRRAPSSRGCRGWTTCTRSTHPCSPPPSLTCLLTSWIQLPTPTWHPARCGVAGLGAWFFGGLLQAAVKVHRFDFEGWAAREESRDCVQGGRCVLQSNKQRDRLPCIEAGRALREPPHGINVLLCVQLPYSYCHTRCHGWHNRMRRWRTRLRSSARPRVRSSPSLWGAQRTRRHARCVCSNTTV